MKPMVIAVDFDGCLCENRWPEIGKARQALINHILWRQQRCGDRFILWTCREGERLAEAVAWCAERGLFFAAVNDNLPENIAAYGSNSRKIEADEYWDDKAVTVNENWGCAAIQ